MHIPESPAPKDEVKDALAFAQQLADHEIESIERLHKRTLNYLSFAGVFVVALAGIFGYIGYSNLKSAATTAAQNQMRQEVTRQVQDKLTQENVNQIVRDQLRSYSTEALNAEIRRELTSPPLSDSIREAAGREVQRITKKQMAPRHLTAAQSKTLIASIDEKSQLAGVQVGVNPAEFNVEANNYASEIKDALAKSKLKIVQMYYCPYANPVEGVGIYYATPSQSDARLLQDAFDTAGVKTTLVACTMGAPGPLEVFVGSKPLQ